jgi:long-chain acyl-CoA synthetase
MNQMPGAAQPAVTVSPGCWTIETLLEALAARGERPALRWLRRGASGTLSGAALADRSRRLAAALIRDGIAVGEPVALLGRNGPDWVVARLALGAAGALVAAFDDLSTPAELAASLAAAGCRRVLTTARHVPALRRIGGGLDLIVIENDASAVEGARSLREIGGGGAAPLPPLGPDAAAMLVQTSGTTGPPKSFVLTYAHLWANIEALARERLIGPDDLVLLPLPLHHVYPLVVGLLTSLQSGAAVLVAEAVAGPEIVEALRSPGVTVVVGVPRLYAAILAGLEARVSAAGRIAGAAFHGALRLAIAVRRRLGLDIGGPLFRRLRARVGPDLRLLVSGGARIEPDVLWPLVGLGFEVRSGYGLAETASIFTGNLPGRERLGSEGRPFQGGEIRIAEPDQSGIGEILLRGPNVFAGYCGSPEATQAAFTPDGWFRTGDLGYLDADGYLYVTGRTKEMLVLGGGKKVHPEELEKAYGDSPLIREIAMLERAGALVALVLPEAKRIQAAGQRVDDAIRVALASTSQALPSYQRISGFALVREPLPRTRLGKFRRFLLPEIYERARQGIAPPPPAEPSPEDRALLARPLSRQIAALLQERYRGQAIALDANLQLDLGVDSLEWLGLLLALDQRLGLRLAEADAARVETVRDLIALAEAQAGAVPTAGPATVPADMRWIAPVGLGLTVFGAALYALNRLLMRALFRLRVEGLEHLPRSGAWIVVANHASDLDPLVMAAGLSFAQMRRIYWGGAASRLFARPWLRPLWRTVHVMPIDERQPAASLALAEAVLARGDRLIWFPEMWRSPDGTLQRFLPGIGKLVADSGAPAVPAFIAGTFEAMPRDRRLPRPRPVRIRIGPPLEAAALLRDAGAPPSHAHIAEALRAAVAGLGERP